MLFRSQTIEFLKGLLILLKDCALGDKDSPEVIAKRQMLLPMLASMALNKHNKKLYSTRLNATWFENHEETIFRENKINPEIINDFPITPQILKKIELLCSSIITSSQSYLLTDSSTHTVLFKNELLGLNLNKGNNHDIDKWLALISGNIIGTDISKEVFFNSNIDARYFFDIIKNWNSNIGYIPNWGSDLFMGIDMKSNEIPLQIRNIFAFGVNFSYSYFRRLEIRNSDLSSCNFSCCKFDNFCLIESDLRLSNFENIFINYESEEKGIINRYQVDKREHDYDLDFEGKFCLIFCFIFR